MVGLPLGSLVLGSWFSITYSFLLMGWGGVGRGAGGVCAMGMCGGGGVKELPLTSTRLPSLPALRFRDVLQLVATARLPQRMAAIIMAHIAFHQPNGITIASITIVSSQNT